MREQAADRYEIVIEETAVPQGRLRNVLAFISNLVMMRDRVHTPSGMIVTVVDRQTGHEGFRHVSVVGDDDGLVESIERDLAAMSAVEFADVWVS